MNGYETATILCTIVADPTPFASITKSGSDLNGCDIRVVVNQTAPIDGKWVEHARWLNLTAWFRLAEKLIAAKWCKKGYHAIFCCRVKERVYEGKNGPTKTLDYEVLDAQPVLVSSDYKGQQKAREQAKVETARAPQQQERYTHPNPAPSPLADSDYPF